MSAIEIFQKNTSHSRKLYNRALGSIPSGNSRGVIFYYPYPLYAMRGKGSHIWDVDGNERIDYMLNASVLVLGHGHPRVVAAIKDQIENGLCMGAPTELEVELAEKIIEMVPCVKKVRFAVTGSEACMNVLRIARAYTRKNKVIMFDGHFHGTSDTVMSSGGIFQSEGTPDDTSRTIITLPFNDVQKLKATIRDNRDTLAAVMLEPVMGSGGGIPATKDFLETCREITEDNDILLLFDEVQTGFRLGSGGAQQRFGVIPDLVALGKGITGGLPGSAYGGREDIMDYVCSYPDASNPVKMSPKVPAAGTHNAHPLAMAAGLAHLKELRSSTFEKIDNVGTAIRDNITKISTSLGISIVTTGIGSFFHIYFGNRPIRNYSDTKYADPRLLWYFDVILLNKGVFLAPGHTSYTCASISDEDLKATLKAMEDALVEMKPIIKEMAPKLIEQN